ncbi:hypothetical protein LX73_2104 [Fodinibius salinus]|uniref:Uncharacterized protein n=1 Tax=Fodinibius salinus TaxID=860790 RepID=A0A5D3YJQ9_9BACT|nr:hypothetical protein [Fodinibius salinus]TYP92740.1 hypothetical protein LX73_2104 [Fodinibius salinus]
MSSMYRWVIVFIVSIGFLACASSNNKAQNKTPKQDTLKVQNDTTPSADRPLPGLAPGQSRVNGKVLVWKDKNTLHLKVEEVKGYGSGTPPIAQGDTLSIHTIKDQLENPEKFYIDSVITIRIQKRKVMQANKSESSSWSFVALDE